MNLIILHVIDIKYWENQSERLGVMMNFTWYNKLHC